MISTLRGSVLSAAGSRAVIDVGGVGFAVNVTPQHALGLRQGAETTMHTALIVRDDDLSLFGFSSVEELELFDLLRGVGGVGPKSALGVLATLTPDDVARAIADEDDAAFRRVPGIGPKTAKLIVVSLAGKLAFVAPAVVPHDAASTVVDSVTTALTGLGWPERVAAGAAADAVESAPESERANVSLLLRRALSLLGPQQKTSTSARGGGS